MAAAASRFTFGCSPLWQFILEVMFKTISSVWVDFLFAVTMQRYFISVLCTPFCSLWDTLAHIPTPVVLKLMNIMNFPHCEIWGARLGGLLMLNLAKCLMDCDQHNLASVCVCGGVGWKISTFGLFVQNQLFPSISTRHSYFIFGSVYLKMVPGVDLHIMFL